MKKIAISALLVGIMGFAHADVNVYGKARVYEESSKVGSADAVTALTNDTSRIGVKASESLGGGLTAGFVLETGVGIDAPGATTLGDRTSIVTLSNQKFTLGLGRDKHAIARTLDNFDSMGNVYGSSAATIHAAQGSRFGNTIFVSGNIVPGLTVNYQMSNSEVAGVNNGQAGSIDYTKGPYAVTLARFDNGTTSNTTIVGGKYTVNKAGTVVYGMYSENTVANVSSKGKSIGVTHPVNASTTVLASYGTTDTGVTATNLGATYNLNKAVMLHARYTKESAAVDTQKMGVGIEYNF